MRIAMISTPFVSVPPSSYGGTELLVYELTEGLIEQGHEVTLFATGDSRTKGESGWLYMEGQWPPNGLTEANHTAYALKEIMGGEFDLIHAHSACALAMSRFVPGMPLAYTIHHERVEEFSRFYLEFPEVWFVAISANQKRLEAPLRRCEVIHHGLDPSRFEWSAEADDYVCYLGRFTAAKGTHLAIDAARMAGMPIRVAGRVHEPDREYAERELKARLGLPHVRQLGCIGIDRKVPLLKRARALLAPLQWEEPFGLAMIEAMLSGCPVIAFPRGSAPELVEPGTTGFLVNSTEEMAELIRPGGAAELIDREECRRRAVERFSRERLVADHLKLYERLAGIREPGGIETRELEILQTYTA